jgi:hypothetical protein
MFHTRLAETRQQLIRGDEWIRLPIGYKAVETVNQAVTQQLFRQTGPVRQKTVLLLRAGPQTGQGNDVAFIGQDLET